MRATPGRSRCGSASRDFTKPLAILAFPLVVASYCVLTIFGASQARSDVGDLGPPPSEPQVKQVLTDFYSAGHPLGSTVEVRFDGPILVGQPTVHPNPPPQPWCVPRPQPIQHGVRCGHPDPGASTMYPVMALVTVTIKQGLASSALAPSKAFETTTTHNGTSCGGATQAAYCPAYYFYQDRRGNWQVA